ncbi:hypothetical protein KR054_001132, partial [Drosophila jambulina]
SPLEMQLLEKMLMEAEGYPSNDRDLRDISVLPATSIDCDDKDDSLMQAASIGCDESGSQEPFSSVFEDESEECLDFLEPYEPSFDQGLPVEHPCFVRLLLLRTPLLKEDPCANFSVAPEATKTTKKPKKKCYPKGKPKEVSSLKNHIHKKSTECSLLKPNSASTTTPPINSTTMETVGPDSEIINIKKYVPKTRRLKPNSTTSTTTTTTTTSTTMETTTLEETTTPEETTSEDPTIATTEQETTTTEYSTTQIPTTSTTTTTTTPKTTSYTTTSERPLAENQLKRLKAAQIRRRNRKGYEKGKPKVPDPPKIKIDGATQPSEVIHVILPTDIAELRLTPEEDSTTQVMTTTSSTESTSEPETTTEDSCEDEVETTKLPEFPESEDAEASDRSESKGVNSMEEPCEDTEEQDTNLCPQFMLAQRQSNCKPQTTFRYRKPLKNYVEPILYEGNIAKPLHRTTRIRPPQKDYFISNKQIVPRPRPKYRKRLPHSIYMNNIVRGLDCVDEVDRHPPQNSAFWDMRRVGPGPRIPQPEIPRNLRNFAPVPARRLLSHQGSPEESDENPFLRERESEQQLRYPEDEEAVLHEERPMPQQAMPTPSLDPCQVEHDHIEHPGDYPQTPASSHFFT